MELLAHGLSQNGHSSVPRNKLAENATVRYFPASDGNTGSFELSWSFILAQQ